MLSAGDLSTLFKGVNANSLLADEAAATPTAEQLAERPRALKHGATVPPARVELATS